MSELRKLDISQTNVQGPGFAHLNRLSKLEYLYATSTPLDDSAMPHIVANFPRLKRFDFVNTNVTLDGIMQLAELPWLTSIGGPNCPASVGTGVFLCGR